MLKDNLKKERLKNGLTQSQVAERLGVSQAQYARWENGEEILSMKQSRN